MGRLLFYFLSNVLLIISSVVLEVPILYSIALFVWLNLLFYTFGNIEKRYALLIFLISYFIFLLGQEFCVHYLGFVNEYYFREPINQHAYLLLLLGVIGIGAGFIFFERLSNKAKKLKLPEEDSNDSRHIVIRQIAKIGMAVTVLPYYYVGIQQGIFVLRNSYLAYYTNYHSNIPAIIENLSEMFTLFFFMFLATLPSKKEVRWPMLAYLGYGLVFLMTGRRIQVGMTLMMLISYYLMRHYHDKEEKWITKFHIIGMIVAVPVGITALYMFKYIRYGESVKGDNLVNMFFSFFYQQGTSVNVLKFAKKFEGDSLGVTSLYYTIKYFRTNVITGRFFDFPKIWYRLRNSNTALYTNCLPDYIYYRISPYLFRKGYGLGGSFLSELYHDGGYTLTVLGSLLYGTILQKMYSLKSNIWIRTIAFLVLEQFFILPRYGADSILRPFYSIFNVAMFIFCMIMTNIILQINKGNTQKAKMMSTLGGEQC